MEDLSIEEMAQCAKMNFENMAKLTPHIRMSPMFMIAMQQLDEVCERLRDALVSELGDERGD